MNAARSAVAGLVALATVARASAAEPPLPPRAADAVKGDAFADSVSTLGLAAREQAILAQVAQGNVPAFWRRFTEVQVTRDLEGLTHTLGFQVSPEYLAIGEDADYFLAPVTPVTAQRLADSLDCMLPTRRMVDDIYAAAAVKLKPAPIPPTPAMTTVAVFRQHNATVRQQRSESLAAHPLGALVAGHKKDVVVTPRLATEPGKVAIYGWHQPGGKAIQPLYLGHTNSWVDYSHGTRLVRRQVVVDGQPTTVDAVLADPKLCGLLSDEGPLPVPRYDGAVSGPTTGRVVTNRFGEREETVAVAPGVRAMANTAAGFDAQRPVRLVLYALPNGNTIEQTVGRRLREGDDWHFNIQHIGAQTRWLREREPGVNLVVVYLEAESKSWPAWRKQHDPENRRIPAIVDSLRRRFPGPGTTLVLTGHSGGGSFTFGYLNGVERIPDDVSRIAFLDSNYAYDPAQGHTDKLGRWLESSTNHFLCVLAYHDSIALLNGKTFVSESGGTWGRSQRMLQDLGARFPFQAQAEAPWQRHSALAGRVRFVLHENPKRAVLHTVQVELNGFIHALLAGTPGEERDYRYFGERVYARWIAED